MSPSLLQPAKYLPSSVPYLCGPFPPATPSRNQARCRVQSGRQASLRGASPLAPDKPRPQSSALRLCRPPLRSALSIPLRCIARVGRPLGLQLLPPTFARRRSACMYTTLPIQRQRLSATANGGTTHEEQRRIPDHRPHPHPRVHHRPPQHLR